MPRELPLSQGYVAIVNDADFDYLSRWKWSYHPNGAAVRTVVHAGKTYMIWMHRVVMGAPDGLVVDHINGNRLDNRRRNLRICTQGENSLNRRKASNNTSGYIGVVRNKQTGRYIAQIKL